MKNGLTLKDILFIIKIHLIATSIVCLSSCIQLSFFLDALNSKAWKQLEYLWIIGLCIDVCMLLFAIMQALRRHNTSLLPGLAYFFYFISMVFYGKLSFLKFINGNILLLSFLKGIEFSILSIVHILFILSARSLLNYSNKNNAH
ncbi:hypothetical protein [Nostoc sp. FACHB-280]|uniref:hypothetical protein n=1 Tax=Nostoc sp. FACHB-280 TaxID=2692839 RepID=UPI00168B12B8|nr:hypothetical protein [Nostoc sp. FACHB-280]